MTVNSILNGVSKVAQVVANLASLEDIRMHATNVSVPAFPAGQMKGLFEGAEFSCNTTKVIRLLGEDVPASNPGRLAWCEIHGKHEQSLIYATLNKIDSSAWQKDSVAASSVIIRSCTDFTARQVHYLLSQNNASPGCRFNLAKADGCNLFPVRGVEGQISFIQAHRAHAYDDKKREKFHVEVIPYEELATYSSARGDIVFIRNEPPIRC